MNNEQPQTDTGQSLSWKTALLWGAVFAFNLVTWVSVVSDALVRSSGVVPGLPAIALAFILIAAVTGIGWGAFAVFRQDGDRGDTVPVAAAVLLLTLVLGLSLAVRGT